MCAAAKDLQLPEPYFLMGHSMGGCIGLRALVSGLPVKAAVFTAPMWGIMMSGAMRPMAWAMSWASKQVGTAEKLAPGTKARTYVLENPFEGNNLTTDPGMYRYMQDQVRSYPDLALGGPSLHWLHEALKETLDLSRLPSPDVPCLTFLGQHEQIVDCTRIHSRMDSWANGHLEMVDDAEHEVLMEPAGIRKHIFDEAAAHYKSAI